VGFRGVHAQEGVRGFVIQSILGFVAYSVLVPEQILPSLDTGSESTSLSTQENTIPKIEETSTINSESPEQTIQQDSSKTKPAIKLTSAEGTRPVTITVSYTDLPKDVIAFSFCVETGGCLEWVEPFTPSVPNGTYTMTNQKGMGPGSFRVVAIDSKYNRVAESEVFTPQ
jgi:hypothetical protein